MTWRSVPFFILTVLATANGAFAVTFTVDSTADAVDANPGDGACASAAGDCTLRAAIQEANAPPSALDRVVVPAGTYLITIPGVAEEMGATGDLDIRDPIEIAGAGAGVTIIDGNQLDRVLQVPPNVPLPQRSVTISGVTLQHGKYEFGSGGGF